MDSSLVRAFCLSKTWSAVLGSPKIWNKLFHSLKSPLKSERKCKDKIFAAVAYKDLGGFSHQRELNDALDALRSALTIPDKVLGNHQETVRSHREIAHVLRKLGRDDEAKNEELLANERTLSIDEPQPEK
ncbi:hypothetical protein OS493_039580 [Desmophyllum pertusum]|uniref:Uncharacterized protein n=1 Tax=Desmophyllum pertusum TaxID=174260 RepID=A0A9W9Y6M9_9CNID|nr:hypothetical protein OS493_039580 [Desmophyllum pertusum]